MTRIFVLDGHPAGQSLSRTLAQAYVDAAREAGARGAAGGPCVGRTCRDGLADVARRWCAAALTPTPQVYGQSTASHPASTAMSMRSATWIALALAASLAACSGAPVRHAILRHASFAGIEAKRFVGKPVDEAIRHYGKARSVQTSRLPAGSVVDGVDLAGKDLYLFEQSRSNYQISVPVGSQTVTTGNGPVTVHQYERQNRVAVCQVGLVVEPATRLVVTADLRGNCL